MPVLSRIWLKYTVLPSPYQALPGKFGNTSVSEQTIQSLINEIGEDEKRYVKAELDTRNNRILWLFNDHYADRYRYNKVLLYDLTLQAFFLWRFTEIEDGPSVIGIYNNVGETFSTIEDSVVDSNSEVVTTSVGISVVSTEVTETYDPSTIQFVVDIPETGTALATPNNTNFVDWAAYDGTGVTYESFVETGYELMGDAMRKKQPVYVFAHFRQASNSSCKMRAKWDWANSLSSNRWSTEVEAYRERTRPNNSTADNEAFEVVTTKNKVRGSGKSIQFRYGTDEAGKNFELLGWSVAYVGNTQP